MFLSAFKTLCLSKFISTIPVRHDIICFFAFGFGVSNLGLHLFFASMLIIFWTLLIQ